MSVTVILPSALRAEAGDEGRLTVAAAGTVGAVLAEIAERWPRLARRIITERGELRRFVNLYVDGDDCRALGREEAKVPDGAEIMILPSVAGG
ncbi:MoaD/ThiS family protein [Actinocorallia longicatena]|uniref:MoaD/ThiS family protein n=1 Tax=Actinocorallia longicatena TaxID=111803 RepID=A0ABP6PVT3_9ACTN